MGRPFKRRFRSTILLAFSAALLDSLMRPHNRWTPTRAAVNEDPHLNSTALSHCRTNEDRNIS